MQISCLPFKLAEPPSEDFLDQEELDFVSGFDALMEAAHYSRLSQAEWETAEREEFTVGPLHLPLIPQAQTKISIIMWPLR